MVNIDMNELEQIVEEVMKELTNENTPEQTQKKGTYIMVVPKKDVVKQMGGAMPGPSGRDEGSYKVKIQKGKPYWAYVPNNQEEVDRVSGTDSYDNHIYNPGKGFWPDVNQGAIVLQYMFTGRAAPQSWIKGKKSNGFLISIREVEQISKSDPRAAHLIDK